MSTKVNRKGNAVYTIISTPTIKQAAGIIGVTEKTVHKWLNEPAFAREVQEAQEAATRNAVRRIMSTVDNAVSTLETIMQDATAATAPRVTAAAKLLDSALRAYDMIDIQNRLDAIERKIGNGQIL